MSRYTIRIVIILAALSMAGIIATQIMWVQRSFDNQDREFRDRVHIALTRVTEQIQVLNKDSAYIHAPVRQISNSSYVVQMNDTLHPYLLENLLSTEFERNNLSKEFDYGIYDCFTDSIVFGRKVTLDSTLQSVSLDIQSIKWDKDGHYFGVYFPNKNSDIVSGMKQLMLSSLLLLLVILFFSYAMFVILKQKRLSEIKTDFINNMTHELKTPISTISLSSEALSGNQLKDDPAKVKQYAEIIFNENERLKRQVEKVLQIASLDKDDIQLKHVKIDMHALITRSVNSLSLMLQERSGVMTVDLAADNFYIKGDNVHITNIVFNLIDNAIKYSKKSPEIHVSTKREGKKFRLYVKDAGIGMNKEQQKLVFEKFYRVPTGNVHDVKGFGLGLYYVKKIVEAHNGSVALESALDQGSTFSITLPINF